jgi:hypothetical protein
LILGKDSIIIALVKTISSNLTCTHLRLLGLISPVFVWYDGIILSTALTFSGKKLAVHYCSGADKEEGCVSI